jgi:hypothetical protein
MADGQILGEIIMKKVALFALVGAMSFALVGCKPKDKSKDEKKSNGMEQPAKSNGNSKR